MAIRFARQEDLPRMLEIYSPYVTQSTCSFEYEVPSPEEFSQRFQHITVQFPWLVWEEDSTVLGYAYASAPFERAAYRWCAEPTIYLAPEAQRRGIGKRLYLALEELLRLQGYRVCYALITSENQSSLDFHTALGYRFLSSFPMSGYKMGRWLGVTWMEKVLNLVESPSNFPVPITEIVKSDRILQEILAKMPLS